MSKLSELLWRSAHLNPRDACERAFRLAARTVMHACKRRGDLRQSSYASGGDVPAPLMRYLTEVPLIPRAVWPQLRALADRYLEHRFDLLGSGWCQVHHGMACQGVEGHRYDSGPEVLTDGRGQWLRERINSANLTTSQSLWSLVDRGYRPIDWQLDYKSGYRWSEKTWFAATPFGHLPGVDIKVPWELSRMQHLPQLALACKAAREQDGDEAFAARLEREFRNQLLDFIATNPPRFGVNWRCAMDVGIRAANWLVAYDLFCTAGFAPDLAFDAAFRQSIAAHGQHLVENLEWHRSHRSNHYLADVTGLLFIAAYLPGSPRTDAWLAFAVRQVSHELLHQFAEDGSNFEASTSYHRLSAEMALYAVALTLALGPDKQAALATYDHRWMRGGPGLEPAPLPTYDLPSGNGTSPLPKEIFTRLMRAAEFSCDVTKPSGSIHQVGDNDSGRFLRLTGTYRQLTVAEAKHTYLNLARFDDLQDTEVYWDEDLLDHRSLIAGIASLTGRRDLLAFAGAAWPEIEIVRHLAGNRAAMPPGPQQLHHAARVCQPMSSWDDELQKLLGDTRLNFQYRTIPLPAGAMQGLQMLAYPDFGLFLWRSPRLYLAVRCGPVGQNGNGGHAHNDQLAIELQVDGEDWIADAGTYLYTASPAARNRYRSVAVHWAPQVYPPREPAQLNVALFQLPDTAKAQCLHFSKRGFVGRHLGYGQPVTRTVEFVEDRALRIIDFAPRGLSLLPIPAIGPSQALPAPLPMSLGYGIARAA